MKRYYYHGTSADNLESILKNGLSANEEKLWTPSEDLVYLWCPEAVGKGWEVEDDEDCQQRAFQSAYESAQFACAFAKDCRAVVVKIQIDSSEIMPDNSSENMEGTGAVCIDRDIMPNEIIEVKVSNDLSLLKGYFLALAANNEYSAIELSRFERTIAEAFKKAEIYPEDIEDMTEWETAYTRKSKKAKAIS